MKFIRIRPEITWCVDMTDVKVYHETGNSVMTLNYPQAVVWDFVTRKYAMQTMTRLLSVIGQMTPLHAEQVILDALDYFEEQKLITRE